MLVSKLRFIKKTMQHLPSTLLSSPKKSALMSYSQQAIKNEYVPNHTCFIRFSDQQESVSEKKLT